MDTGQNQSRETFVYRCCICRDEVTAKKDDLDDPDTNASRKICGRADCLGSWILDVRSFELARLGIA